MFQKVQFQSWKVIMLAALLVRLIAVIFSQGYGMHDDHFLIVESSGSWVDGYDYNHWLPWSKGNVGPEGHSFSYVGLNFFFFWILKHLGIANPKVLMLLNRLMHALVSLLVVWYSMKITEKLSDKKTASTVGWLLAFMWAMPFLSVRNLVEMAAIPFLVYGVWLFVKKESVLQFFIAGLIIGIAVSFRYQIGVFAIGVAVYYFFRRKWSYFLSFSAGILLMFVISQGLVDYLIWGYPFAELKGYVLYNLKEGTQYMPNHNYLMYFLVLSGLFLVPLGILLLSGFFKAWKKYAVLFIPTLFFILFHTLYPNRQERFILSVLPFFVILGTMGWNLFRQTDALQKWWNISLLIFWVLNFPLLLFVSTFYSKKSRVESMYHLYGKTLPHNSVLSDGTATGRVSMLPRFYSGNWKLTINERTDSLQPIPPIPIGVYDYIYFFDQKDLNKRIAYYKSVYPNMQRDAVCEPSFLDQVMHKLNPRNANEYIEIWKTNAR